VPRQSTTPFGALLRQHRVTAGLTQQTLAERAGLSVYGIQKLEAGTTHPYRDTASRLVAALELSPDAAEQLRAAVEPLRKRDRGSRETTVGRDRRHNLPIALTRFVGREHELSDIPRRLRATRLLTLTGAGGSGKTRLALEVARLLVNEYRDGVWLVELAPLADDTLVPHRLAALLGVRERADRPMPIALAEALHDAYVLVVLDNCEHLLEACSSLADVLLRECPTVHVLTTSREPLGIPGELSYPVGGLAAPVLHLSDSVAHVERSPAAQLFVDRASVVQPALSLAATNARAIAQICRQLDGIPLALELAAGCLDALTLEQLASRLHQRFRLLTGGNRAGMARQQTLRATIDWSYQLLTETAMRVFERLSVFAIGWTLEAAEAVCAGDAVEADDVLDAVRQLVRKSLIVRIDDRRGAARYGLLDTLREYASEKLRNRDGEVRTFRERHAAYYANQVQRLDPAAPTTQLKFSGDGAALTANVFEVLDGIHDNLGVALNWFIEARRPTEALTLLRALGPLWAARGVPPGSRRWVEAALDLAAQKNDAGRTRVPTALHASVLHFGATNAVTFGDIETARHHNSASIELWRTQGDDVGLAQALVNRSVLLCATREYEPAAVALKEALALARTGGKPFTVSMALSGLGTVARLQRRHDLAAAYLRESVAVARSVERASDCAYLLAASLTPLGRVLCDQRQDDAAMALFKEALEVIRDAGMGGNRLCYCLQGIAVVHERNGDPLQAVTLFAAADAEWRASGHARYPDDELERQQQLCALRAELTAEVFAESWALGESMTVLQAITHALG
jgi:non-specific serine/threonine protein kinase